MSRQASPKRSPKKRASSTKRASPKQCSIAVQYKWGTSFRQWQPSNMPTGWRHVTSETSMRDHSKYDEFRGSTRTRAKAMKSIKNTVEDLKAEKVIKNVTISYRL